MNPNTKTQHDYWQEAHDRTMLAMAINVRLPENSIVLNSGGEPMLTVSTDGFWVRGVKVKQDDKESEIVYNAFKQWLEWSMLNRE